jgi:hypothetical protein
MAGRDIDANAGAASRARASRNSDDATAAVRVMAPASMCAAVRLNEPEQAKPPQTEADRLEPACGSSSRRQSRWSAPG